MAFKGKPKRKPVKRNRTVAKAASEDTEQIALIDWANLYPEIITYLFCIPNQRQASAHYGYKLKRMGVKSGVSDLFFARPNSIYSGLWIELKRIGGILSKNQEEWLELMNLVGYKAVVCYGWIAAKEEIIDYMRH